MAHYEHLPAFKATYDLLLDVYKMNVNLTREYRYTIGEKLKIEVTELMVSIYKANVNEQEKEANLRRAREHMVVTKIYMRLLHDLKQIPPKRFISLSERAENVSKQITAWHKSVLEKDVQS